MNAPTLRIYQNTIPTRTREHRRIIKNNKAEFINEIAISYGYKRAEAIALWEFVCRKEIAAGVKPLLPTLSYIAKPKGKYMKCHLETARIMIYKFLKKNNLLLTPPS